MAVKDRNILPTAGIAQETVAPEIVTAVSLAGAVVFSYTPGHKFQVTRVRSFCRTKTGTVTATVKVGGRTAASVTFTAATEVAQTLSTTLANLRGSASEAITIELTTDGTGALTNGKVVIAYRPHPMNGEA